MYSSVVIHLYLSHGWCLLLERVDRPFPIGEPVSLKNVYATGLPLYMGVALLSPTIDRFNACAPKALCQRRADLENRIQALPSSYTVLIERWLSLFRGREQAAKAANNWMKSVQPALIQDGLQRSIVFWVASLEQIPPSALPVWPLNTWKVEHGPACTRRFINRARLGDPMFKQKGRDLCGQDGRFISLIAGATLTLLGLVGADKCTPSVDLEDFVLVFDRIHQYMHSISLQQSSTIKTIEFRRQEGHREWLHTLPGPRAAASGSRRRDPAEEIFNWALDQALPMRKVQEDPTIATGLRRQKLIQTRRHILLHIHTLRRRISTAPEAPPPPPPTRDIPLTVNAGFLEPGQSQMRLDRDGFQSVEVLARDLLALGLWCLQADTGTPEIEEMLNETLYALSTKLVAAHTPSTNLSEAELSLMLTAMRG